jgi:hypothetical protein
MILLASRKRLKPQSDLTLTRRRVDIVLLRLCLHNNIPPLPQSPLICLRHILEIVDILDSPSTPCYEPVMKHLDISKQEQRWDAVVWHLGARGHPHQGALADEHRSCGSKGGFGGWWGGDVRGGIASCEFADVVDSSVDVSSSD